MKGIVLNMGGKAAENGAKELIERFLAIDELESPGAKAVQIGLWAEDVRAYKRRQDRAKADPVKSACS